MTDEKIYSVNVNPDKRIGRIKPMHAINNMPTVPNDCDGLYHTYTEARIPYARLHDTGGQFGGTHYVDVENIFPDFDADENDEKNYDFAFTDALLSAMADAGVKPFYRLGCTIENYQHIKSYHLNPPRDYMKWARICEHIILHYNYGWANGYSFGIEYWEIWNEPDNEPEIADNPMWKGSAEDYYRLYDTAATYLKDKFPDLKIGGYASCGFYAVIGSESPEFAHVSKRFGYFIDFFEGFLKYISDRHTPLDFFSWHSYAGRRDNIIFSKYCRDKLTEYGYAATEMIFNEWNPGIDRRSTVEDCVEIAAMMCTMQHTDTDMCMYYDGQINSRYCGLFNPVNRKVFKAYYAFWAFGELYALGTEVPVDCDAPDLIALGATDKRGHGKIILVNTGREQVTVCPGGASFDDGYRFLDGFHDMTEGSMCPTDGQTVIPPLSLTVLSFSY